MHRVPEVIDCWFDSADQCHLHSIIIHLKIKNYLRQQFPAQFISEAVDQTRGWFYSLLAISTLLFNKAPYKNVIVLGHVQDENGQKMSKSKGNAVDPFDASGDIRSRCDPLVFLYKQCTVAAEPFPWKSGYRKDSVSSWEHSGILMHSSYCMQISMSLMQQNMHLEYDKLSVMDKWLLIQD